MYSPSKGNLAQMLDQTPQNAPAEQKARRSQRHGRSALLQKRDIGYRIYDAGIVKWGLVSRTGLLAAAFCTFCLLPFGGAQAATVEITGAKFNTNGVVQFPGYGSAIEKNNVVGFGPSGLSDPTNGAGWRAEGNTKPSAVLSNVETYAVDWYFLGAESGDAIKFMSQSLQYQENNQNNRYNSGNDPGWLMIGTTNGSGVGQPIPFTLIDTNPEPDKTIANGANHKPGAYVASLMFAYVEPVYSKRGARPLIGWKVTMKPTDWFAFGYDDPGSANNDHDDFMMIGHLRATPLPGALGLMGSFLGGGYFLARWRRWRARRRCVAVA